MRSEREQRALDALIVSQLRACDETNVEHLPELTDDERASLDSLGIDFVERLLAGQIEMPADAPHAESEVAMAGNMRAIEFSLLRTCPVRCSYCPQDALREASREKLVPTLFSFDDFKCIIDKLCADGEQLRVEYAGFTEPGLHPDLERFITYAASKASLQILWSTGKGLTRDRLQALQAVPNLHRHFHVRPPEDYSAFANYDGEIWEQLDVLNGSVFIAICTELSVEELTEMQERCQQHGIQFVLRELTSRAALVNVPWELEYYDQPVTCDKVSHDRKPVVIPGGAVVACCNDFALKLPLGNLVTGDWNSLDYDRIIALQSSPSKAVPCFTDCNFAKERR